MSSLIELVEISPEVGLDKLDQQVGVSVSALRVVVSTGSTSGCGRAPLPLIELVEIGPGVGLDELDRRVWVNAATAD